MEIVISNEREAESRLATLCAQFVREGVVFTVTEEMTPHYSGLHSVPSYVIKFSGGF